jgi:hypothetical protein
MGAWTDDELAAVGSAEELELTSQRPDGSLRPFVTMWAVRVGDDLYVRSAHGPDNGWYRRAIAIGNGRIRAGGVERDVDFTTATPGVDHAVDAAYHAKYDCYGPSIVGTVVGPAAAEVTVRLVPRDAHSTKRRTSRRRGHRRRVDRPGHRPAGQRRQARRVGRPARAQRRRRGTGPP